jgi:hypothetical protein
MLTNTAVQAGPGILARRPAALTDAVAAVAPTGVVGRPRTPWAERHLTFRGTRVFTALMLAWVGLILFAFGAFAVPAANDLGRAKADAGLMSLLGSIAPLLWGLGVVHVVAAVGVARDRLTWGFGLAIWMLAIGALVVAAGLVFALAGRDPFALADPASPRAANGTGLLIWTLGLYALAGWGVRRIVAARQLLDG